MADKKKAKKKKEEQEEQLEMFSFYDMFSSLAINQELDRLDKAELEEKKKGVNNAKI